ncbi:MAG: nitrile hydratase subunit alpha [Burkholderiales bacterium]
MSGPQIQNRYPFRNIPQVADLGHAHAPQRENDPALAYWEARTQALARLLDAKSVVTADEVRRHVDLIETVTPMLGARVVARAWVDPNFKGLLLADAKRACTSMAIDIRPIVHLTVLENTADVHHVVVCTLCSCYPRPLLGEPPGWYKSTAYRNRIVVEPRVVLKEAFGLDLPVHMALRVVDSTADSRFFVLPRRPARTDTWSEGELMSLVTRDSMVGVTHPLAPDL